MWFLAALAALMTMAAAPAPPAAPAAPAPPAAAPAATGTLKGKVTIPQRKLPVIKDYGAKPSIKVERPEAARGMVWVDSGAPAADPASISPVRIEQRGYQFRPDVVVVRTGTPIVFPNEDQMYHSVFSISEARPFDLGRYRKGEEPDAIVFDKPGMVQLFCEVHEHMRAHVQVVDTPWFTTTAPDGAFSIAGLPPGKHTVHVWLGPDLQFQKSIEIVAGKDLDVDWKDEAGTRPK
jgi:plastocyanin